MKQLTICFGALCEPLKEQLKDFNITDPEDLKELDIIQKDIEALNRVRIRGVIPHSVCLKAEQKMFKKIARIVEKAFREKTNE